MEEAQALEAVANVLTLLGEDPYNVSLHAQHVQLARATEGDEQLEVALDMLTTFWAAGDYAWIPIIEMKSKAVDLDSAQGLKEVLAWYEKAEDDYLCAYTPWLDSPGSIQMFAHTAIPLLKRHAEFLIERHQHFSEEGGSRPDDLEEMFTTEWTLDALEETISRGAAHLMEVC